MTFRFFSDPERKTYTIISFAESMETKRKPSCNALTKGGEKRPRRLSNADLISSSPTTSDLF